MSVKIPKGHPCYSLQSLHTSTGTLQEAYHAPSAPISSRDARSHQPRRTGVGATDARPDWLEVADGLDWMNGLITVGDSLAVVQHGG